MSERSPSATNDEALKLAEHVVLTEKGRGLCPACDEYSVPDDWFKLAKAYIELSASRSETRPTHTDILQAVARGWCSPDNEHKEMDGTLATAIADEVMKAIGGEPK